MMVAIANLIFVQKWRRTRNEGEDDSLEESDSDDGENYARQKNGIQFVFPSERTDI